MEKLLLISAIVLSGLDAYAATARSATSMSSVRSTSGRNVVTAVPQPQNTTGQTRTVATRNTVQPVDSVSNVQRGRSAITPVSTARAAKQSVINNSTKIAAATQNTAVDQVCWEKFSGCMDSFCMLDNGNGGRCICSDKNAEYDAILAEIQSLDEQSYQMATVGVERIEMGNDADVIMSKTNAITKSLEKESAREKSKRPTLDLSAWNVNEIDFDSGIDVDDMFSISSDGISIEGKTGDALYRVSAKLCNAQIPNCSSQAKMMELMYKQRIRSDCTAYENSLRQQRTQSAQKLATAQRAMRDAALEQYRDANKYDLGQCTVLFKQCMQTTGGCGDDFTGCVEWSVRDGLVKGNDIKMKTIKGTSSKIELSATTYDVLESKKELCMGVTQQCVNVRDKVWDTFLREVAPQVKSAELIVESNMRTSCISTISSCFQKACRENMDPNDPDGSYDMCLTRPETLREACRVEIDPCAGGIPNIMDYVRARLASMRVDSCTNEFKTCLQSEDRCGKDYTQCVGLDYQAIIDMCPDEKLVGCYYEYGTYKREDVKKELEKIAQGIFLNIDNSLLKTCQKAVQSKVIEVCGSLSECDAFADDDIIGTDSLISYKDSNGDTVIEGLMNYGLLKIDKPAGKDEYEISDKAFSFLYEDGVEKPGLDRVEQRIKSSVNTISNKIKQKIAVIASDTTIDMCINGRSNAWRGGENSGTSNSRFSNLLDSYELMIFNSGLDKAYKNYRTKYDELVAKALEDQSDDVKSMLCAAISYDSKPRCEKYEASEKLFGMPVCKNYSSGMETMFSDATSGLKDDGLSYVIKGADIATKLNNMTKAKGEFIQTDANGNMIGKISMASVYSPSTNTCVVTTTSVMCANIEKIITENKDSCFTTLGIVQGSCNNDTGGIFNIGVDHVVKTQEYHGTVCTEYGDPVVTTNEIEM